MGNNKVRRRDQANLKPSSTAITKADKHDPALGPTRISTTAHRTLFGTYIKPPIAIAIAIAMNTYQLLFGMTIFVYGTLYEVIHRIWMPTIESHLYTPTTKSQRRHKTPTTNKKSKGKKGKPQHKVAAQRKIEPVRSADPPPPPQAPHLASPPSPPPKSVASVTSTNEDDAPESPAKVPATQMSPPCPSPTPASEDDTVIKPVDSVSNHEAASGEALRTILGIASPKTVNIPPAIPLSDTVLLFQVAEQEKSEEGVSTNQLPKPNPNVATNHFVFRSSSAPASSTSAGAWKPTCASPQETCEPQPSSP
jgi:hypothetical protein